MSSQLQVPKFKIVVPEPEERQRPILNDAARFKIVAAGRRFGKTVTGLIAAVIGHGPIQSNGLPLYPGAVYGRKIWWVAPTYTTLSDIWRNLKVALDDATIYKNENEHRVDLPGGGSITVRSTEAYDNLRGPGVDGMVLDEAAYINGKAWTLVLRPMLADRQGWAMFMSTPNGKNWWYDIYEAAATEPHWRRWHAPSTDNPRFTAEELESIRRAPDMTEAYFSQEYLAQFNSPGANPFRSEWFKYYTYDQLNDMYLIHPRDNTAGKYIHRDGTDFTQEEREAYDKEHPPDAHDPTIIKELPREVPGDQIFLFVTVDLAISIKDRADYTVMQVWGSTPAGDLLLIHQVRGRMENPEQLATLNLLNEEYHPNYFAIEKVGYQLALIQQAKREGLPVKELKADKDKISRAATAVTRMAAGKIIFPYNAEYLPALKDEIASFPHGHNDDQVDAMAYAAIQQSQQPRKMMFKPEHIKENDTVFFLPDYTNLPEAFMFSEETTGTSDLIEYMKHLRSQAVWQTERGPIVLPISVEHMLSALSQRFRGDYTSMYHTHIAVSKQGDYAAISLGRIERWDQVFGQAENQSYVMQVPFFEVPLILKVGSQMGESISNTIITDFVIALKGIRGFNITSASVTGIKSATAVQKLIRANIAVMGLQVDPNTGIPTGIQKNIADSDVQPYIDLRLAIENYRLATVQSEFLMHELMQIEDTGKTLAHDSTAADALAHTVGFLAKYGHQVVEEPDSSYVPMENFGIEKYTGLQVSYDDY